MYRPQLPRRRGVRILRTGEGYRVAGPAASALDEEALREALRDAGARPGDPVVVGERTFAFE